MSKIPLIVIAGATASGKTALAVELALRLGGEVVSADSMQIYREISVGTAKPDTAEMRGVPHHMQNFLPPEENYSVAEYVNAAHGVIAGICARWYATWILTGRTRRIYAPRWRSVRAARAHRRFWQSLRSLTACRRKGCT